MKKATYFHTIALLLFTALIVAGCGSSYSSISGSAGYGVYHGYDYPYHRYGSYYDRYDYNRNVDRDKVQQRRQERIETRPERRQNIQTARSRASSMGRPARAGRGGRR